MQVGDPGRAAEHLRRAVELLHEKPPATWQAQAYESLGQALLMAGDASGAQAALARARDLEHGVAGSAVPLAQDASRKKDPRARLAEPWPDAERMRQRREEAEARPLFGSSDPLPFTLTADFKAVSKDRKPGGTQRFPAVLSVVGDDGRARSIPVTLRTRGHARLVQNCGFVPLRVQFPREDVKGTPFEGQGALKLGTHCHGSNEYEQYALREYLAYRIFNLLTPRSFRVRLARATYVDSRSGKTVAARHAMFLESEGDLARRMSGRIAELPHAVFRQLDSEALTTMMLFEYMIGNTDLSIFALHNVRLVQDPSRVLRPVPYDFDYSGLVNARYAVPSRLLKLQTVLDRAYRGPCRTVEELEPFLADFRAKKPAVMAAVDSVPGLDPGSRRGARKYLDEFYSTIDDPRALKRELVDSCGKRAGM
jgi:hypothetical protein